MKGIPARPTFTRDFQRDKKLLQREQKSGVSPFLTVFAYLTALVIGLGLYGSMGVGLRRLQRALPAPAGARNGQYSPSTTLISGSPAA